MTQVEEIEKAAKAYTQKIIDSNSFEVNYEEDNYDAGSLHATSEICPMAFKAGAKWAEKHHAKKQAVTIEAWVAKDKGSLVPWLYVDKPYLNEDHVSYDLAKALKDAGFDLECEMFVVGKVKLPCRELKPFPKPKNWNKFEDRISVPPLSQAHKWLREVKGIAINVIAHYAYEKGRAGKYHWKEAYLPNCNENGPQWRDWCIYGHYPLFNTYEEALSDGLSKILELINFIQETK